MTDLLDFADDVPIDAVRGAGSMRRTLQDDTQRLSKREQTGIGRPTPARGHIQSTPKFKQPSIVPRQL
jgi:hypothetical protein